MGFEGLQMFQALDNLSTRNFLPRILSIKPRLKEEGLWFRCREQQCLLQEVKLRRFGTLGKRKDTTLECFQECQEEEDLEASVVSSR